MVRRDNHYKKVENFVNDMCQSVITDVDVKLRDICSDPYDVFLHLLSIDILINNNPQLSLNKSF